MGSIDKLTVVSTDGASQVSKQAISNMSQVVDMVAATAGVDVAALLAHKAGDSEATGSAV